MKVNEVVTGDVLMLFDEAGKSIGGATNHTLTVSPEYNDIACKDAGLYGWKKLKKITWEIQTENLFIDSEYVKLLEYVIGTGETGMDKEFTVYFGYSNWDGNDLTAANWTPSTSTTDCLFSGKVKISSLTLNAQAGENATYSATLTGVSSLKKTTAPA